MVELLKFLLSQDPLKLSLVCSILALGGFSGYKGFKHFHKGNKITGIQIVNRIEEGEAPFPRHWSKYIDDRINHRIVNSPVFVQAMNKINNLEVQISEVKGILKEQNEGARRQTEKLDKIIGRLFPNEPL